MINALLGKTGIDPAAVEDVIVGGVSQVSEQSSMSGAAWCWPQVCRSRCRRQRSTVSAAARISRSIFAAQAVLSGTQDVVLAEGVEHMTRVPMGSPTMLAMQAGIGKGPWSAALLDKFGVTEFSPSPVRN